jgi:erythromycin esterase-like protein
MTPLEYVRDRARPFDEFSLPPDALAGKRLFLFGETHYIAETLPVKTEAVRHLVEEAGVRHVVIEGDPIVAAMLDHYMGTGDGGILDILATDPVWGVSTPGDRSFYESLHSLSEAGTGDPALRIEGYELNSPLYSLSPLCRYIMRSLGSSKTGNGMLLDFLEEYSKSDASVTEVFRKMKGLLAELRNSEAIYREKLGQRYDLLVSALSNYLALTRTWFAEAEPAESSGGPSDDDAIRERVLAASIADLYRSTSDGIVVWYGATHIDSKFGKEQGITRFGDLLRSDEEIRRASLSTVLLYANCEIVPPDAPRERCYSDFPYDLKAIAGDQPYDVSFLATRGQGSPFDAATGGARPVSHYADYLIFIRNRDN